MALIYHALETTKGATDGGVPLAIELARAKPLYDQNRELERMVRDSTAPPSV